MLQSSNFIIITFGVLIQNYSLKASSAKREAWIEDIKPATEKSTVKVSHKTESSEEKPFFDPRRIFTCNRKEVS